MRRRTSWARQEAPKVRAAWLAPLVAAVCVLAGCTSHAGTSGSGDQSNGAISFAVAERTPALDQAVQQWNSDHPSENVSISVLPADPADRRDTLVENLQNHAAGYDVVGTDLTAIAELASQHWVEPLTGRFAVDTSGLLAPAVAAVSYKGPVYAAPYSVSPGLLFYRSDLLHTPPATWAALTADCGTAQRNGVACFTGQYSQGADLTANLEELIAGAGGRVLSSEGAGAQLDSEATKQALHFLADSYQHQVIPGAAVTYQQEQSVRAFSSGALLMLRATPSAWTQLAAQSSMVNGRVGVALLPGLKSAGPAVYNGYGLALNSSGKHLRTGAAFIRFLTSHDIQRSMLIDDGEAPAATSLYSDSSLTGRFPFLGVLQKGLSDAQAPPVTPAYANLADDLANAGYAVVAGTKSPDQASQDLQNAASQLHLG